MGKYKVKVHILNQEKPFELVVNCNGILNEDDCYCKIIDEVYSKVQNTKLIQDVEIIEDSESVEK